AEAFPVGPRYSRDRDGFVTHELRNIRCGQLVSLLTFEGAYPMAESTSRDAIALLKDDHRKVEELFKQFEKASGDGRKEKLAQQICLELSVHATIEEEIFYPACEGKVEEDLLKES